MNFNADGDKILTGSFDGTAIVYLKLNFRFGILELANLFIFYKVTQDKYHQLNFNLEAIFVEQLVLIRHVDYGM